MNIGVLGKPGTGKSEKGVGLCLDIARSPGAYLFAHDPGYRIPDQLHDGRDTRIARYETEAEAAKAISGKQAGAFHAMLSTDARSTIELARHTAECSLEKNGGTAGFPSVVYIDEVVAAGLCNNNYLDPLMGQLLTLRRHWHCGVVWTVQSARLVHNQLLSLSTGLYIFRLTDGKDFDRLSQCGVETAVLDEIAALPDYEYRFVKLG